MNMVFGVGINDADYTVHQVVNGKRVMCLAYRAWANMMMRCYSHKYHAMRPTYIGVTVCDDWKSFMAFRSWWLDNHVVGLDLDKDLLTDEGVYSPGACIYVPKWLNNFTASHGAARGDLPIGVCYCKRDEKYIARCNHPFGKVRNIGRFVTPREAHLAWLSSKLEIAEELKGRMDDIDTRIYPRIVEIINRAI